MMRCVAARILSIVLAAFALVAQVTRAEPRETSRRSNDDPVIAIDVLLVPDAAMVGRAEAANAKLRENYPAGYTLGVEQAAHITLVHRYVRKKDLPAIESAIAKIAAKEHPREWQLTATGYGYSIWAGLAVTVIEVERSKDLSRLDEEVVKAVEPFAVKSGTKTAFSTTRELPKIDDKIVEYVEKFTTNSAGPNYNPHVTIGVAHEGFVKQLKAAPFEKFSFKAAGVAIYQLGNFGTAQKK